MWSHYNPSHFCYPISYRAYTFLGVCQDMYPLSCQIFQRDTLLTGRVHRPGQQSLQYSALLELLVGEVLQVHAWQGLLPHLPVPLLLSPPLSL